MVRKYDLAGKQPPRNKEKKTQWKSKNDIISTISLIIDTIIDDKIYNSSFSSSSSSYYYYSYYNEAACVLITPSF